MDNSIDFKLLEEFESADERFKQLVTEYQKGHIDIERFATAIAAVHDTFCNVMEKLGNAGKNMCSHLNGALEKIRALDGDYIALAPHGYHQTVWEAHQLLVSLIGGKRVEHSGASFIGWEDGIPSELKNSASREPVNSLLHGSVIVRTENGWRMYISQRSGVAIHFTVIKRVGDRIEANLSDFMPSRIEAAGRVLLRKGFKKKNLSVVPLSEETIHGNLNHMLDVECPLAGLDVLLNVIYSCRGLGLLHIGRSDAAESRSREALIIERVLEKYVDNPIPLEKRPFHDYHVYRSDLYDVFASCSDEEAVKIVDELLSVSREEAERIARERFGFS